MDTKHQGEFRSEEERQAAEQFNTEQSTRTPIQERGLSKKDTESITPKTGNLNQEIGLQVDKQFRGRLGEFDNFLATSHKKEIVEIYPEPEEERRTLLSKHGFGELDAPDIRFRDLQDYLTEQDWDEIRNSQDPLLSLHATVNAHRIETLRSSYEKVNTYSNSSFPIDRADKFEPSGDDLANLGTLPLVHGTNYETLSAIIKEGRFLTEREIFDRNISEGQRHESHTVATDRRIGLDQFVFTHFGRPQWTGHFGEIEIHFRPHVLLEDQRSFVTQHDYLDIREYPNNPQMESREARYKDEILQGRQFYQVAARLLRGRESLSASQDVDIGKFITGQTDETNNIGDTTFSTWEVKTKGFELSDIDSILFASLDELRRFQQEFPQAGIDLKFRPSHDKLAAAIQEVYGKPLSIPVEYISRNIDQVDIEFPGWRGRLAEYFGARVVFTTQEAYRLQESNCVSTELSESYLSEGGDERLKRLEESTEEKVEFFVRIDSQCQKIKPEYDFYKLHPKKIYRTQDEAQAEVLVIQKAREKNSLPGTKPSVFQERFLKVICPKSQLDAWLETSPTFKERSLITDFRIESDITLAGA